MQKRSIGKMLLLYIVTLGFYRLYWLAKTRGELVKKTKQSIPSIIWVAIPYLLVVASVVGLIVAAVIAEIDRDDKILDCQARILDSARYCEDYVGEADLGTLGTISIIGIYASFILVIPLLSWWYWKYSKAVEIVTKEKLSFPVAMIVILAVPDIFDMLIIQDSFNKIGAKEARKS